MEKGDFFKYILKTDTCWVWLGTLSRGYGTYRYNDKTYLAHRFMWMLANKKILKKGKGSSGKIIMHTCDNPSCVNPKHLILGTQDLNMKDCAKKKRIVNQFGEDNHKSKLTEKQVIEIRKLKSETNITYKELSQIFKISKTHACFIVKRHSWRKLK